MRKGGRSSEVRLSFIGAARQVTGSCVLVEAAGARFLVDCGMYQGRDAPVLNREPWPFDPAQIDFVLLTHAHVDHCGLVPKLRVYVDSPLALKATGITLRHPEMLDAETRARFAPDGELRSLLDLRFVETVEESKALNDLPGGAVIIAASGMCDAGRIRHHLRHNLPRTESAVLIVGYQAEGTLGRRLVDHAASVRMWGEDIPVRARIHTIGGLSAHADHSALLAWLARFRQPPQQTFVVHGEEAVASGFAAEIAQRLRWPQVEAPTRGQVVLV